MDHGIDSKELVITDTNYKYLIKELTRKIKRSGVNFNHVVCIGRGGLRPGDVISRALDLPLAVIMTRSYKEDNQKDCLSVGSVSHITPITGQVLLVDDLLDTGDSVQEVKELLIQKYKVDVKVAVIWKKTSSKVHPDYFVEKVSGDKWVVQPFEVQDKG